MANDFSNLTDISGKDVTATGVAGYFGNMINSRANDVSNTSSRPSYKSLLDNYLGSDYSSKDVYDAIGGKVSSYYFKDAEGNEANSCALRISLALNKSGYTIDSSLLPNAFYVSGADGDLYILRVADMIKYLRQAFSQPDIVRKKKADTDIKPSGLNGSKGIIAFTISGWNDATGHVTLFDGTSCVYGSYFQQDLNDEGESNVTAKEVALWILQ